VLLRASARIRADLELLGFLHLFGGIEGQSVPQVLMRFITNGVHRQSSASICVLVRAAARIRAELEFRSFLPLFGGIEGQSVHENVCRNTRRHKGLRKHYFPKF